MSTSKVGKGTAGPVPTTKYVSDNSIVKTGCLTQALNSLTTTICCIENLLDPLEDGLVSVLTPSPNGEGCDQRVEYPVPMAELVACLDDRVNRIYARLEDIRSRLEI